MTIFQEENFHESRMALILDIFLVASLSPLVGGYLLSLDNGWNLMFSLILAVNMASELVVVWCFCALLYMCAARSRVSCSR